MTLAKPGLAGLGKTPRALLRRSGIGAWLFVTPLIGIVFFVAVVLVTLQGFRSQESILADIRSGAIQRLENNSALAQQLSEIEVRLVALLTDAGGAGARDELLDEARAGLDDLQKLETELVQDSEKFLAADVDRIAYDHFTTLFETFRLQATAGVDLAAAGDPAAEGHLDRIAIAYQELLATREAITVHALDRVRGLTEAITVRSEALFRDLILILTATAAVTLLVSWLISALMSRDVLAVIGAMKRLAESGGPVEIQGLRRSDEIGDLARAAQVFANTLQRLREEIEQRENTEDALRAERNFVSTINETVGALIVVLDRSGRIVRFNRACEALTGYSLGEVVGTRPWDRLVAPDDRAIARARLSELSTERPHNEFEAVWTTAQGAMRQITWSNTTLLDSHGEVDYVICCGIDITERKMAEAQLRQTLKLEAVGQLTGGIAHDFNNLLAVILIDLDLVSRRLKDDEHARRMLDHAVQAGQRGAALTNRLLSFSRQQPLRPETVRLDGLLDGMLGLFAGSLGDAIEIDCRSSSDLWLCTVDRRQLVEALLCLALNARDAMADGGRLLFDLRNARLAASDLPDDSDLEPGDYVELSVTDTGCGIPEEARPRVFDPFFTTKPVGKGSGLGLSMVYGFMKQSHGQVTIQSRVDWGTTVRLYFPRSEPPATAVEAPPTALGPGTIAEPADAAEAGGRRVLLVEDDADLRSLTASLLESLGYSTVVAENARQALAILEADDRFDLLFADLSLPGGMTGAELGNAATAARADLKVLYMSGYPRAEDCGAHNPVGERQILRKPFRKDQLERALLDTFEPLSP